MKKKEILERLICSPIPGKLLIARTKPPRNVKIAPMNIAALSPLLSTIHVEAKHMGTLKSSVGNS